MSILDDLKGKRIKINGVEYPDRKILEIIANGATVADSEGNNTTTLDIDALIGAAMGFAPEAYGAQGDGVTDDSAALQAAIDAAIAAGGCVVLASVVYRCASTLTINGALTVQGCGRGSVIFNDGSNKNAIVVSGDQVALRNFTIRGNGSGLGSTSAASGGHGVFLGTGTTDPVDDFLADGLFFESIGAGVGSSAACLFALRGNRHRLSDCFFESSCAAATGADVALAYATQETQVVGCYSRSEMDSFVSLGAVTYEADGSDVVHHTIQGCIATRATSGRSAVIFGYGSIPSKVTVAGNVFVNFPWNGVYAAGAVTPGTTGDSEGAVITGNVIAHCGGGNASLSSGILITGTAGAAVADNLILSAGTDTAGIDRANAAPGIRVLQFTTNTTITGNTISDATGNGIAIVDTAGNGTHRDIIVANNTIRDCDDIPILLQPSGASCTFSNITIQGNNVFQAADTDGIRVRTTSSGTATNVNLLDNTIEHTGGKGTSTAGGINWWDLNSSNIGRVEGNTIRGFSSGVKSQSASSRSVPDYVRIKGNHFDDCTNAVALYTGSGADPLVALDSTFRGCTSKTAAYNYNGRSLGFNASDQHIVEVDGTAAPTTGSWLVGDRVRNTAPTATGVRGWICTTAGTPGTWTEYTRDSTAIHTGASGEISALTLKGTPVTGDHLLIEDSAAANAKKRVTIGSLPVTDASAIHDNVSGEISAVTLKVSPVSGDYLLIEDSAASNAKKSITIGSLPGGSDTSGISYSHARADLLTSYSSTNTIYLNRIEAIETMDITHMGLFVASASGTDTCLFGIYSASLTTLIAEGSFTPSVAGWVDRALGATASLTGGTDYWIAVKLTNGSANIGGSTTGFTDANQNRSLFDAGGTLPASAAAATAASNTFAHYLRGARV